MKFTAVIVALCATSASGFGVTSMQEAIAGDQYAPLDPSSCYPASGPGSEMARQPEVRGWGVGSYTHSSLQSDLDAVSYDPIDPSTTYPPHILKERQVQSQGAQQVQRQPQFQPQGVQQVQRQPQFQPQQQAPPQPPAQPQQPPAQFQPAAKKEQEAPVPARS